MWAESAEKGMKEVWLGTRRLARGPASVPLKKSVTRGLVRAGEIIPLGPGQIGLAGRALELFRSFARIFAAWASRAGAHERLYPSLIPASVIAQSDYFASFPQHATFVAHLGCEESGIDRFTAALEAGSEPASAARPFLASPANLLCSAVCYHCYQEFAGKTVPVDGMVLTAEERCFRFEGQAMVPLARQWEFTMREIVFLGSAARALEWREKMLERAVAFADALGLAGEIAAASDPFFGSNTGRARALFQQAQELKYELRLTTDPPSATLAVASFNLHQDYFGRAFEIGLPDGSKGYTACAAFGIERWVLAALAQGKAEQVLAEGDQA